eukprot:4128095-Lingulodinium_polyedra.AAC.1
MLRLRVNVVHAKRAPWLAPPWCGVGCVTAASVLCEGAHALSMHQAWSPRGGRRGLSPGCPGC